MNFNRVILMGRLTRDVDFRMGASGVPVANFSIAVDRRFTKQGEERKADFFNVVVFRERAEFVSRYFGKGKPILVEGALENDNYTDRNGVMRYTCRVVADNVYFVESKGGGTGTVPGVTPFNESSYSANAAPAAPVRQHPAAAVQKTEVNAELSVGELEDFEEIISDDSSCPF